MNLKNLGPRLLRRGVLPLLPARRRLPFEYWLQCRHGEAEAELVHLDRIPVRPGAAIDAGANIGLYSFAMSRLFRKVYAFEIDRETSRDLKDCRLPNVEVFDVGLSNRAGEATLRVPVLGSGRRLDGWASLESDHCPDAQHYIEKAVSLKPLDQFGIEDCSLLKIDVEGHERQLLEGAVKTIERGRPVILIEIRERNESSVRAFLDALGYRRVDFKDVAGVEGSAGNHLFLPPETVRQAE
jgi:FkbM family methyltransferase